MPQFQTEKEYRYILYFGMQMLTREKCLSIIEKDKEQLDEVEETIVEMGEEEERCYLHESIGNMNPRPHHDYYEIGYPAKLSSRLLDSEGWTIVETRRYGAFERNIDLKDGEILGELCGESGESNQRYKKHISIENRAHVSTVKADLRRILETNDVWLNSIINHLDEIEALHPRADVEVMVFHPSTALMTLYFAATRENSILYLPSYHLILREDAQPVKMYFGCLIPEGPQLDFHFILKKYYDDDYFSFLLPLSWGGYETRDIDILGDIGLHYRSFRCDIDGEDRLFFGLRDFRWKPTEPFIPFYPIFKFMLEIEEFMETLIEEVSKRWDGSIITCDTDPPTDNE